MRKLLILTILWVTYINIYSQVYTIKEITDDHIKVEFRFDGIYNLHDTLIDGRSYTKISGKGDLLREKGEPWLPVYSISIGIPLDAQPSLKILSAVQESADNKFILPMPGEDPKTARADVNDMNREIYSANSFFPKKEVQLEDPYMMRYARVLPVSVSPYQYNPVTRQLVFNRRVILQVDFNNPVMSSGYTEDSFTDEFLSESVINPQQAKSFKGKFFTNASPDSDYWYSPLKTWFKVFLKDKGLYRITFEYLANAGADLGAGVPSDQLELYCEGVKVPIDVVDNGDSVFNAGDYFQFIGYPPSPSQYSKINIYTQSNVYWFSFQGSEPLRYKPKSGYPGQSWDRTIQNTLTTLHFEKDSIYERLGHAPDDKRDYWFWGKAVNMGNVNLGFEDLFTVFKDLNTDYSHEVTLRVNMHGMTTSIYCSQDHKADFEITGQPVGSMIWDGQTESTFEKTFYVSEDSIKIYPVGNTLNVWLRGNPCQNADEIRINWYEFDYWRFNRTGSEIFDFKNSEPYSGVNRYWLFGWPHDSMKIYIPSQAEMITDAWVVHDSDKSVLFVDTVSAQNEYFCASYSYFKLPDSISRDVPSDLHNLSNGADYVIIAHRDFTKIAEDLALLRSTSFPDKTIPNPRIKIVYIDEIYDEFSYGMLSPYAVRSFLKYTFEKWTAPAPLYVALLGDMSYDYRKLLPDSRPDFIPSIPFQSIEYGQAASDNMFVAVSGDDASPDMAIGRISIETVEQGEVILDKLRNYPSDPGKEWKQNVLLLASGLSEDDENKFGFNDASMQVDSRFLEPNGFSSTKVFRYPNRPEYQPFRGEGPQIRKAINQGATLVNYYGHGGGYQWDLVFLNDDIYLLENGGRLPVVLSITCYTAHFDNQDVFGEQFIKVPGKGAIGFWGSSGVTLWGIGNYINDLFFNEVFNDREYIVGKAIMKAKQQVSSVGYYTSQIALLTYLGDPVMKMSFPELPDFKVTQSDISISPEQPLAGDSVTIKVKLRNLGIINPGDSVYVELTAQSADTSYLAGLRKIASFGEYDSLYFSWVPDQGGLFTLTAKVNESEPVNEIDHSDNIASNSFAIYDLSEPNIIKPLNGEAAPGKRMDFLISDIGYFLELNLQYVIEIDSTPQFSSTGKLAFGNLQPQDGLLKWTSPDINFSPVYWRSRIIQNGDSSRWSLPRFFNLGSSASGYYADGNAFKNFPKYNLIFSGIDSSLVLNTDKLPPKPNVTKYLDTISVPPEIKNNIKLTILATDGTYFYLGNIWYYSLDTQLNPEGKSYIYKVGTGFNGTTAGQYYGKLGTFYDKILNQFFYYPDGNIYVGTGRPNYLRRINVQSGAEDSVNVPDGMLDWESAKPKNGAYYLYSDGEKVYNLTLYDSTGALRYVLRTFDPKNNWTRAREDLVIPGSYGTHFSAFYVYDKYLYTFENYASDYMRRYRLEDGYYEEEWATFVPFQGFYAWTADKQHNRIYSTVFYGEKVPKIFSFTGNYIDAQGNIDIPEIGPASKWNNIKYSIENKSQGGIYQCSLFAYNKNTKVWDTLSTALPSYFDMSGISTNDYPYIKASVRMVDSSFNITEPIRLKNLSVDFTSLPEVQIAKKDMSFSPDSILQGFPVTMNMKVTNVGYSKADTVTVNFYLDEDDTLFYSKTLSIAKDSTASFDYQFGTTNLAPATLHKMKVTTSLKEPEFFTFNNISGNGFLVARDSINPVFSLTVDGKEILNGDIVSARPEILISLKDNGPLPLRKDDFTLVYNNMQVGFDTAGIIYNYTPYPNSEATLKWNPVLKDGKHTIEILAKDASGNFFDSTSAKYVFYVYNQFDMINVFNYPNPFRDNTYFTFELHGDDKFMEEFRIKLYTIAGRLIKDINVNPADLRAGFNKIYWDGRDQDGDVIANGVYFYKIIITNNGVTKTTIQKLAKVR